MAGDDEGGGGDQQQQQRQEPEQPPRQQQQQREGLRALYARVKSAPLEVYAIDTAGVAPIAPPPDNDGTGPSSPSPSSSGYEQVPLRTRASVLDSELRAVLSAPPTLEALHAALERAVLNLRATEAFDDAWAELDGEPQVKESRRTGEGGRWGLSDERARTDGGVKKEALQRRAAGGGHAEGTRFSFFSSFLALSLSLLPNAS